MESVFATSSESTADQRERMGELQKECFSDVGREEIQERFIAEGFGWIFAIENQTIMGKVDINWC